MKSPNLNQLSDLKLVVSLQRQPDDEKALKELIRRHSGIYINMVTAYTMTGSISHKQELIAEKDYHIYQCALKFNANKKTKFSTFLGNMTKWMCLNLYNKNKKHPEIAVEDIVLELNQEFTNPQEEAGNKELLDHILKYVSSHPDPRVGAIFSLRYIEGQKNKVMPWKKISSKVNMSVQGCINIHDSIIKKIQIKIKET